MTKYRQFLGKRALYIDDELDRVKAIADFVEKALKLNLVIVDSPNRAFEAMRLQKFDLVILDIRIMDAEGTQGREPVNWRRYGLYFLQELRAGRIKGPTPANVPLLVITCVVSSADLGEIDRLGTSANGTYRYVPKPVVRLASVEEAVAQLLPT